MLDALTVPELDVAGPAPLLVRGPSRDWSAASSAADRILPLLAAFPAITIAMIDGPTPSDAGRLVDAFDLLASPEEDVSHVLERIDRVPQAATVLAQVLRTEPSLLTESLAYSTLQSGREHRTWLAGRGQPRGRAPDPSPRVRVADAGAVRVITLDRPSRHNAFDGRMRQELDDALATAESDAAVRVVVRGAGPSFCSGGDLEEFGTVEDPAQGHVIRLAVSPAARLERLRTRTTAVVHGWCIGAGIELTAFAARVIASSDARFRLPEVSMGLIPGSGGTVSIRRRIGSRALLALAISGTDVDAAWALQHGLVDEVIEPAALASVHA